MQSCPKKRARIKLPPDQYKVLTRKVMSRDGFKCRCCGSRNNLTAHHITFRSQGGDDVEYNLITLCSQNCHEAIHSRHLVILPLAEGQDIEAGKGVKWLYLDGWLPNRRT